MADARPARPFFRRRISGFHGFFWLLACVIVYNGSRILEIVMPDPTKKLSRPAQEAERAAALRNNLKKRKSQAAERKKDKEDNAKPQN